MCPKPFSWAKNKRKLFSVGKKRKRKEGRAALKLEPKPIVGYVSKLSLFL